MVGSVTAIISVLFVSCYGYVPKTKCPIVRSSSGTFEGSILTTRLGKTIYAYRGIRYAEAPVGELRFKPPVPITKYEGIYNATVDGPFCPQPKGTRTLSEDCLILNVYSTKLTRKGISPKRPVIVHLHPGGFYSSGSPSDRAGPQYFMDQDIVLVTFNYRLGSLGFLSTGDKHAPGNNGLKDQVVLLKWVKKNIEAFGGDPNSITLLGYSAGGRSVLFHLLSPMSTGLFHKAVIMSGAGALGSWPTPTNQLELAKRQARLVGCPDDTSENIVKCLRTVPVEQFEDSLFQLREFGFDPILVWSPVIEGEYSESRFITEDPVKQVLDGRFQNIPIIFGQTSNEFDQMAFNVINNETLTNEMNNDFERVAPIAFMYERGTEQSRKVSKGLRKFYLNDKPVDKSQLKNLGKLYSDGIVGFGTHRATRLFTQFNTKPVYSYCFSFKGRYSHFYLPGSNRTVPLGVVHHDDLIYLFYNSRLFPYFSRDSPQLEASMIDKLTKLYADFARTGKPILQPNEQFDNVDWEPFSLKKEHYLDIGEKFVVKEKLYRERFNEWEKLYPLSMYQ